MVDARLADGSRVNAIIPPLALDGPAMSIRRFGSKPMQVEDLVRHGAFPQSVMDFLSAAVQARVQCHHQRGYRFWKNHAAELSFKIHQCPTSA